MELYHINNAFCVSLFYLGYGEFGCQYTDIVDYLKGLLFETTYYTCVSTLDSTHTLQLGMLPSRRTEDLKFKLERSTFYI